MESTAAQLMTARTTVYPEYRLFGLNDPTCESDPGFDQAVKQASKADIGWGPHVVMINVVSDLAFLDVDLEVWDGPPPLGASDEFLHEGELALPRGQIGVWHSIDSPFQVGTGLPSGPGTYGVRVVGEGRLRAREIWNHDQMHPDTGIELADALRGVERYRILLWQTATAPRWPDDEDDE
jgi:hypothetical protein